jgi:hypothetical protein
MPNRVEKKPCKTQCARGHVFRGSRRTGKGAIRQMTWPEGRAALEQELELLQSFPFKDYDSVTIYQLLKSFVDAFIDILTRQRGQSSSSDVVMPGTPEPLTELSGMIALIERRECSKATMWELMTIRKLLVVLGVDITVQWNTSVNNGTNLQENDTCQRCIALWDRQQSCLEFLSRLPPQYVATRLEPVVKTSTQSGGASSRVATY